MEIRKVTADDVDLLFQWANDPDERRNAFHSEKIEYEDHCNWFAKKLASDDVFIFILMQDLCPVGQCRLEMEDGEALISYFIDKSYRGKGYGKTLLRLVQEKMMKSEREIHCLTAQVKLENIPSQHVFEALGYEKSIDEKNGFAEYHLYI